jgi:RNA polymerase sigma-70 factor, ECF subfamily
MGFPRFLNYKKIQMKISDEQLVEEAVAGDKDSFGALVERYWAMAVAIAYGTLMDSGEAEDLAQKSFILAYSELHKLRERARFAGWLGKIVKRKSIDRIRKSARNRTVSLSDIPEHEYSNIAPAAANPGLTELQQGFVRKAVRRLPEKFRQVVLMRFIGNLSTAEIARQLGKKPGTVRVWLHRAYKKLRDELSPLLIEENEI